MDLVKVLIGAFILVTSLFALVFIGGTFLIVFPAEPLRIGSAVLTETGAPPVMGLVIAVVFVGGFLLSAATPVLLGVGLVVKGVLE